MRASSTLLSEIRCSRTKIQRWRLWASSLIIQRRSSYLKHSAKVSRCSWSTTRWMSSITFFCRSWRARRISCRSRTIRWHQDVRTIISLLSSSLETSNTITMTHSYSHLELCWSRWEDSSTLYEQLDSWPSVSSVIDFSTPVSFVSCFTSMLQMRSGRIIRRRRWRRERTERTTWRRNRSERFKIISLRRVMMTMRKMGRRETMKKIWGSSRLDESLGSMGSSRPCWRCSGPDLFHSTIRHITSFRTSCAVKFVGRGRHLGRATANICSIIKGWKGWIEILILSLLWDRFENWMWLSSFYYSEISSWFLIWRRQRRSQATKRPRSTFSDSSDRDSRINIGYFRSTLRTSKRRKWTRTTSRFWKCLGSMTL